jgi:hypothetical protein
MADPVRALPVSGASAWRITAIYAFLAAAWILFSDSLLAWVAPSKEAVDRAQSFKRLLFVATTALVLHTLIRRQLDALRSAEAALQESEQAHRALAENRKLLLAELNHRVKNNLAGLFSLVSMYAATATQVNDFAEAIRGKLMAMKTVHELIASSGWKPVDLQTLVRTISEMFLTREMSVYPIAFRGEAVQLSPYQAGAVAMIVQELLTNSRKHGALARPGGSIEMGRGSARASS